MKISGKIFCVIVLSVMFFAFLIIFCKLNNNNEQKVTKVISPVEFVFENGDVYKLNGIETFSDDYTENNKILAKKLSITEDEAFILGNLGKYWAKNLVSGRKIKPKENNLICYRFKYLTRFKNSPFAILNEKPSNERAFAKQLGSVRKGKFIILDLDTEASYSVSKENREKVKNYIVIRKSHIKDSKPNIQKIISTRAFNKIFENGNIKIIVSDLTEKLKPDRHCSSDICKEIINNINRSKTSIDIAIYGYSSTPAIESAIEKAKKRGVKIRLIYDIDSKGNNIYPDTQKFTNLIPDNISDKNSPEVKNTMHNKFYIFDGKIVITGSANLSHTDMSGYNSNSIIIINSKEVAQIYTNEFNQMFAGKFHNSKEPTQNNKYNNIQIFFSPQDKAIENRVLPLIQSSKKYIYIPAFVITEKRITEELINAKKRGVDVRVIADALNASAKNSKHNKLRDAGILVKAENYAGKMHSKTIIIDDNYLIIGSMNFSNSGENRNDENMVILTDSDAAKFYKKFFLYQWEKIPKRWLKYTPRAEGKDSIGSCSDGIDNNYDGKIDMEDDACRK